MILALAALAPGCETPATGVLVVIGTDIDPALPLTCAPISSVSRTGDVATGAGSGDCPLYKQHTT